jgi:molecular chaperone GrpE
MKKKIPIKEEELEEDIIDTETPKEHAPPEEASPDWKAKSDEYLNDLKRLQADFENYKKRMENERKDTMRFITTGIISDLVPILDNFNMAVAHVPEDKKSDPWVTGITYIEKQFEEVIAGYGVNVMNVKPGDDFDPTRHEAIGSQQSTDNNEPPSAKATDGQSKEDTAEAHKIVKVLQKGYTMDDKVIRAAKVTVS